MVTEIFKTEDGTQITAEAMWGGARIVGHMPTHSRIGKTQYPSLQAALNDLRANSVKVR